MPLLFAELSSRKIKNEPQNLPVWVHFSEVSEEGSKRVRCLLCPQDKKPWVSVPNATRMAKHLAEEHKTLVKPEVDLSPSPASSSSSSSSTEVPLPSSLTQVEQPGSLDPVPAQLLGPKLKMAKLLDYLV